MEFKFIDSIFPDYLIQLEVLEKDTNLYTTLLYQHKGTFEATATKFGNQSDCTDQFLKFANLAKEKNVSLAITPEYSCPWSTITSVLDDPDKWPVEKKIWVFGCESITPAEILAFKAKYGAGQALVYFDETVLNNGGGVLLDPICYVFQARNRTNGSAKLVLLVQFKTRHMGVWGDATEQVKYINGKEIYVLRNDLNSIYLFTINCSEVEHFKIDNTFQAQLDNRWDETPYIILNIQMNPKPSHETFRVFRNSIITFPHKEIISLNWAKGSIFSDGKPIVGNGKSAILFKSEQIDFENDTRFTENHYAGLFYTYKNPGQHTYYLSSNHNVFFIANQKPAFGGANPAMVRKTGPESRGNFEWDDVTSTFKPIAAVDDNFISFLDKQNCQNQVLRDPNINVIDKERLINISTGNIDSKVKGVRWYTVNKLYTFSLGDTEVLRRLTVEQDLVDERDRIEYIDRLDTLNTQILPNPAYFPDTHSHFRNNCNQIMFYRDIDYDYKFNLVTTDGNHKATASYIGRVDEDYAEKTLKQLQRLYSPEDQSKTLVIVWYRTGPANYLFKTDSSRPKIGDDTTVGYASISK